MRVLTDEKAGVLVSIEQIIRHPDYKPPMMYADIALIKLHRGIRFTASIHPACLHQQYDTMPTKSTISGWGVTEFGMYIDNLSCKIFKSLNPEFNQVSRYLRTVHVGIRNFVLKIKGFNKEWDIPIKI